MHIARLLAKANKFVSNNSPTILTMIAVGGVVSTTAEAIRATPKALWLLNEKEIEKDRALEPVEVVQVVWKEYIYTAVLGSLTIVCIIGSNSLNQRRNAALAGIYAITEGALKQYQEKVKEIAGEKQYEKIQDAVSEERLKKNLEKLDNSEVIILDKGDVLFFDELSSRYFKSNVDIVNKAVNEFNHDLLNQDLYKPLNDFYDLLGLEDTVLGQDIGWHIDRELLKIHFSTRMAKEGLPCISLNYDSSMPVKL